jgi:alpha-aminoadipate carrier protein LysW
MNCPECGGGVGVTGSPQLGQLVECPDCRSELEVTAVAPIRFAAAPDIEED